MKNKSEIIIGCMRWGAWGAKLSTKEQAELITFCVENGNNTFDHADIYGDYTTESDFGKAFTESNIPREKIKIISKCGIQNVGKTRNNKVKHYNYSKEYIIWSAEKSLRNLETDYLDTFLLHRPSPLMQANEIAEAITFLKESGKVKNFGVSNFTLSQLDLVSQEIEITTNQIEVSLSQNKAMFDGTIDYMTKKNIQTMSWSPLGSVFKLENEQTARIKKLINELSNKYKLSEEAILLAWVLKHPASISPVIGTTNKKRIKNANEALEVDLDLEDWFMLLEESLGHRVP